MQKTNNKIAKIISAPIAAQITILPIMIKNFNTISLTFLISNLIAMPLLGICIIGGYLLAIFSFIWLGLAKKIGIIFNIILKALILIARFCGNLKLSNIYVVTPSTITMVIYYFIVVLVIYIFQYREKVVARRGSTFLTKTWSKKSATPTRCNGLIRKILIIILVLIIIMEIPYSNYNGKLKIYFIDQTTPNMIQRISGIFERKPLISKEI